MKKTLILIALLLTVATVTSCKENLVNDNSGKRDVNILENNLSIFDNSIRIKESNQDLMCNKDLASENPFVGEWYGDYINVNTGIKMKVVFTETTVTAKILPPNNSGDIIDECYYDNVKYKVLSNNAIEFEHPPKHPDAPINLIEHRVEFLFNAVDTLTIDKFAPGKHPNDISQIGIPKFYITKLAKRR